ncbi:unnamed protein product, partial [Ectocarpus fasciculatus]
PKETAQGGSTCSKGTCGKGEPAHTLVLLRHGESSWNRENKFTGWVDVPLSEKGEQEAQAAGRSLKEAGFTFDVAFTSMLKRAIKTLWMTLEQLDSMFIPITHSWRLNERHYGALQGLNKQETMAAHGKEQVMVWRRSYDIPPPPLADSSPYNPKSDSRRYPDPTDLPMTESLKDTERRVMVDWETRIAPAIRSGKRVLITAHGNTLRALVKYLDNIPKETITDLNIPTGVPLIYHLDSNLNPLKTPLSMNPLSGYYLGNQEEIKNRINGVAAQTK